MRMSAMFEVIKLVKKLIEQHYSRNSVKETLIKVADYQGNTRIAVFDNNKIYDPQPTIDNRNLFFNEKTRKQSQVILFKGNDPSLYPHFIDTMDRVYYLTLNYLPEQHHRFSEYYNYGDMNDSRQRIDDFDECVAFTWSVDIDLIEPHDVENEQDLEMLMKAVQHVYETFKEASNGHVLILFSGGGAYLQLHPSFGSVDYSIIGEERIKRYKKIRDSINNIITELERTFEYKYPEYAPYTDVNGNDVKRIKFDRINNINRQIKAPMSLHRSKPYAVLPIIPGEWKFSLIPFPKLTDDDLVRHKRTIFDFIDNEPTNNDLTEFMTYITQWEPKEDPEVRNFGGWKEVSENDYNFPDPPYKLEQILQEPITKALCSDKVWNDGNIRRNRIIASILKSCGWNLDETRKYLYNKNKTWNTDYSDLDRIIGRGFTMYSPNFDKIYCTSGDFSRMGLQDVLKSNPDYLPEMPIDYKNPVQGIHMITASENKKQEQPDDVNKLIIKLLYPTNNLLGFEELDNATELSGDEYLVIKKALWYSLVSYRIRKLQIKTGNVRPDCRVHLLLPIKTGHGKSNIKYVIKKYVEKLDGKYGEPTSLYSEQLIGKIVKVREELHERPGYLADDYFVVDEAYQLLKSKDTRYTESRSYLRTALDTYPDKNTVHKRMTEFGREQYLEFNPHCPAAVFLQPFRMEDDILVTEGDVRRFLIPYVNLTGVNKDEAFKNRLLKNVESDSLNNFVVQIKTLNVPEEFTMSHNVKLRFLELFFHLMYRGMSYSEKIRNFTDTIGHTLMNWLMKLGTIQAFQHHRNRINEEDIELAYIDLFEFMEHEYQYISVKIPGNLDYGEMWLGATSHDQDLLKFLYDKGATSLENSKIPISEYQQWIMDEFMVKDKQARRIMKKHRENGWISTKQGQHESFVWLAFDPNENSAGSGWTSDMKIPQESDSLKAKIEYYKLIKKYEK